jgi:dephospho-CoA kinase
MQILAIVKAYGEAKQQVLKVLDLEKTEFFDFDLETDKLLVSGGEGYRQIVNYFGEEFLTKGSEINQRKLWKFVYQDHHKLRIFNFLLEPLLLNELQKIKDISTKEALVVFMPGLVDLSAYGNFKNILWLDWPKDQQLQQVSGLKLPVLEDKFWDVNSRLFVRPDLPMKISKSSQTLQEDIESWRDFLYKESIGI